MPRNDGRSEKDLREIKFTRGWLDHAEGSVLVEFGKTRVLCVASFTPGVPRWLKDTGNGWVTSEYSMLPRATHTRSDRESVKGKLGGRTQEISRLVGRSLRAVVNMKELGENTIVIDCDVLQADGGTRTAAITGAYVALADAIAWVLPANTGATASILAYSGSGGYEGGNFNATLATSSSFNLIPEPSSASLLALGMAGLVALRARRKS